MILNRNSQDSKYSHTIYVWVGVKPINMDNMPSLVIEEVLRKV